MRLFLSLSWINLLKELFVRSVGIGSGRFQHSQSMSFRLPLLHFRMFNISDFAQISSVLFPMISHLFPSMLCDDIMTLLCVFMRNVLSFNALIVLRRLIRHARAANGLMHQKSQKAEIELDWHCNSRFEVSWHGLGRCRASSSRQRRLAWTYGPMCLWHGLN